MRRGNPIIRVWRDVYSVYREVAEAKKFAISDLVSIVLIYAAVFSPLSVAVGLWSNYDMDLDEALNIAFELQEKILEVWRHGEEDQVRKA